MTGFGLTCCSTADMSPSFFEEKNIPFAKFHFTIKVLINSIGTTVGSHTGPGKVALFL